MPSMTKRVNVTTTIPVRTITPPLNGTYKDIIMSTGDILKCISRRAIVDEILPNGMSIRLTIGNYYKDNGAGLDAAERAAGTKVAEEKKPETGAPTETHEEPAAAEQTRTEEEQAPEAPANVEPEAPVVETELEAQPEAGVEPTASAEVAQATEEPPVANETDAATCPDEEKEPEAPKAEKETTSEEQPEKAENRCILPT